MSSDEAMNSEVEGEEESSVEENVQEHDSDDSDKEVTENCQII